MIEFSEYYALEHETQARVITDSYNPFTGYRATTLLVTFPRFILPEMNTHRKFSRNVASSRAKRFSEVAKRATFVPKLWIANHKGMQGSEVISPFKQFLAKLVWSSASTLAYWHGRALDKLNVSKQYSNRLLEPFIYIDYLVTSTEWDNFFNQRIDYAAQFEMQVTATRINQAIEASVPKILDEGIWHLPFVEEGLQVNTFDKIRISGANCARTSYSTEGNGDLKKDCQLFAKLAESNPPHLSPLEHQLFCTKDAVSSGNIDGFIQLRKVLEEAKRENVSLYTMLSKKGYL